VILPAASYGALSITDLPSAITSSLTRFQSCALVCFHRIKVKIGKFSLLENSPSRCWFWVHPAPGVSPIFREIGCAAFVLLFTKK
jgi:hypothetical protein